MCSTRETALMALHTALLEIEGPQVERNLVIPDDIPSGGLLILRDGDPGEPEVTLSPVHYDYEHEAQLEVLVQGATAAVRDAALDALLVQIPGVLSDTTLGGAVDYVEIREPELDDEEVTGAEDIKGAVVPIVLYYGTSNPLT